MFNNIFGNESRTRALWKEYRGILFIVLGMAFFRTAIADWNYVPSASMEPTLYEGDYLLVDKMAYGPSIPFTDIKLFSIGVPQRGDIITFYPPHTDKLYVKRVIGVPGDAIRILGNQVFVNGEQLKVSQVRFTGDEFMGVESIDGREHSVKYIQGGNGQHLTLDIVVPPQQYFVLGDNRNNSVDSRFWGFVSEDAVMGKASRLAVSFSGERDLSQRIGLLLK